MNNFKQQFEKSLGVPTAKVGQYAVVQSVANGASGAFDYAGLALKVDRAGMVHTYLSLPQARAVFKAALESATRDKVRLTLHDAVTGEVLYDSYGNLYAAYGAFHYMVDTKRQVTKIEARPSAKSVAANAPAQKRKIVGAPAQKQEPLALKPAPLNYGDDKPIAAQAELLPVVETTVVEVSNADAPLLASREAIWQEIDKNHHLNCDVELAESALDGCEEKSRTMSETIEFLYNARILKAKAA
jgi:hypothetical protein